MAVTYTGFDFWKYNLVGKRYIKSLYDYLKRCFFSRQKYSVICFTFILLLRKSKQAGILLSTSVGTEHDSLSGSICYQCGEISRHSKEKKMTRLIRFAKAGPPVLLLTAFLLSVSGKSAHAGITQYNSQVSFTSSTTGITTVTFEGQAAPGGVQYYGNPGSLSLSGVQFASQGNLYIFDPAFSPGTYNFGTGANLNVQSSGTNVLTATLPVGVTAVATNLAGIAGTSAAFTITLTNGSTFNYMLTTPTQPNTFSFVGFTTDTGAISSISFSSPGNIAFDNFQYGTASIAPVPEPGEFATAFALFGTTAVGMVTARLKARRRKSMAPVAAA